MANDPKRQAREDAKRAQKRYAAERKKLDRAIDQRRQSFERAREAGLSLAEIGDATGLSRGRVSQILKGK